MKAFKFNWSYLDRLDEIEPGSLDEIRMLLRYVATSEQLDPLGTFFSMALAPFYDRGRCIGDRCLPRLPQLAGNVLYRLSDLVPRPRRETLAIYESVLALTLEGWRQEWVSQYKKGEEDIPVFLGDHPIDLPGLNDGR